MKKILYLSVPRVAAMSMQNAASVILIAFASTLSVGSISVLQFARNIHFLPIGMFGISFALAAYPSLNEHFLKKDVSAFFETFFDTLRSILFWALPSALLFYVLRAQIVRVAFGAGNFDWQDTRITAALLGILSFAILAESLTPLLIRAFYALGNTRKPFFISVGAAFFTVVSAFFLIAFFRGDTGLSRFITAVLRVDDLKNLGVLGIAGGILVGMWMHALLLAYALRAEARRRFGSLRTTLHGREMGKIALAALAAGFAGFGALRIVTQFLTLTTFWSVFAQGAIAGIAGFSVYGATLFLWRNREMRHLVETIRRRARPSAIAPHEAPEEQSHETYG